MSDLCKGCGAPIVWATTAKGRAIPLDAKPMKRVVLLPAPKIPGDPGRPELVAHMVDTYMPHHATCPNREDFRRGH